MEKHALKQEMKQMVAAAKKMARARGRIGLSEPEDIAQDALVRVLLTKEIKSATVYPLLYRAVHSAAKDAWRKSARERRSKWLNDEVFDVIEAYERQGKIESIPQLVAEESRTTDRAQIEESLSGLSKPLRETLLLYLDGYSYREIARLTKSKIGTVRSRLHVARRRARKIKVD